MRIVLTTQFTARLWRVGRNHLGDFRLNEDEGGRCNRTHVGGNRLDYFVGGFGTVRCPLVAAFLLIKNATRSPT